MGILNIKKRKDNRKTHSEIDALVQKAKSLSPEEISAFIHSRFTEDLQYFKKLVTEHRERLNWAREKPRINHLFKEVNAFYGNLIEDNLLKKDLSLFERDKIDAYKTSQAREEAINLLQELDETKYKDYKKIFRNWNKVYANNYETLCNMYLVGLAQQISKSHTTRKSKVLKVLTSYRNGSYAELLKSLNPQIRNSIQHQDFIIDPKKPEITFYDRNKPPLRLTIEEYSDIFWESFFLMIAFDIACFDLQSGIIDICLDAIDTVDRFIKEHNFKWVEGGNLSLLDWASLIKSGEIFR
jgi:hypothetical protein